MTGTITQSLASIQQRVVASKTVGEINQVLSPVQQAAHETPWIDPGQIPPGELIYEQPPEEGIVWG